MNTFQVNQEVVCINASILPEQYIEIKEGEVYKIRWIGMCKSYMDGEYVGVRVHGIERGYCPQFGDFDPPYRASRFKPVQTSNKEQELEVAL